MLAVVLVNEVAAVARPRHGVGGVYGRCGGCSGSESGRWRRKLWNERQETEAAK